MRITVNGVSYHVERAGQGEPLLVLHGFTGSGATWDSFIPAFERAHSIVAIDFLGHGKSDSPTDAARYGMDRCVADLAAILDQLEIERANVLGYSMGGRVALQFAHTYPGRTGRLILESASPGIRDANERALRAASDDQLAETIERDGVAQFVEYWTHIPLFATQARLPQETRDRLRTQRLENNAMGLANSLRGLSVGRQTSLWDILSEISMPTLLLAGELDAKYTAYAREMAHAMPNAHLQIVPGAGHTVHLEQPDVYEKMVLQFLKT